MTEDGIVGAHQNRLPDQWTNRADVRGCRNKTTVQIPALPLYEFCSFGQGINLSVPRWKYPQSGMIKLKTLVNFCEK